MAFSTKVQKGFLYGLKDPESRVATDSLATFQNPQALDFEVTREKKV